MIKITENIFRTAVENPFGNSVCTAAYLVTRPRGNLLFYSSSKIDEHLEFIEKMGGLSAQYISHRDEASASCDLVLQRFHAPLFCHPLDADAARKECAVGGLLNLSQISDDLQYIHTPGHSPGSTCFVFKSQIGEILFTGDTLYPNLGKWCVAIDDGKQVMMVESLRKLMDLDIKLIIPSLFIGDVSLGQFEDKCAFQNMLLECIQRLESGETH